MTAIEVHTTLLQGGTMTVRTQTLKWYTVLISTHAISPAQSASKALLSLELLWNDYSPKKLKNSKSHPQNHIWFPAQYQGVLPGLVSRLLHSRPPLVRSSKANDQSSPSDHRLQVHPMHFRDAHHDLPIPGWKRTSWIRRSLPVDHPHPHPHSRC